MSTQKVTVLWFAILQVVLKYWDTGDGMMSNHPQLCLEYS